MSTGAAALQPTFTGHVNTTQDALVLFEACLTGQLSHVPRRPHDRERNQLIRSGCVFIYEENASGIKRWTDGVTWSPSRILGNFLVYRELDKPFPPGEKKRAMKKNRRPPRPGEPYSRPEGSDGQYSPTMSTSNFDSNRTPTEVERSLIGSLIDSYGFKENGLVKKTMSVTVQGVTHHLVSYYNVQDVINGSLRSPSQTENLQYIRPRLELTAKQSFRSPIEETDETVDGARNDPAQAAYGYRQGLMGPTGYPMPPNTYYMQNPQYPPSNYHPATSGAPYGVGIPPHNYLGQPVSNPSHKAGDYDPFTASSAPYQRGYEAMSGGAPVSSLPPSMSSLSTNLPDRSGAQHPSMYTTQSSMPSRQLSNPSPGGLDSRTPQSFSRGGFGTPQGQPIDNRRPMQPSPAQNGDRRDPQPVYPSSNDRQPYYMNGAPPPLSHSHYQPSGPMPSWNGSNSNQPQI